MHERNKHVSQQNRKNSFYSEWRLKAASSKNGDESSTKASSAALGGPRVWLVLALVGVIAIIRVVLDVIGGHGEHGPGPDPGAGAMGRRGGVQAVIARDRLRAGGGGDARVIPVCGAARDRRGVDGASSRGRALRLAGWVDGVNGEDGGVGSVGPDRAARARGWDGRRSRSAGTSVIMVIGVGSPGAARLIAIMLMPLPLPDAVVVGRPGAILCGREGEAHACQSKAELGVHLLLAKGCSVVRWCEVFWAVMCKQGLRKGEWVAERLTKWKTWLLSTLAGCSSWM